MRDKLWHIVDVRDVADALLLLYETPAASGRHICAPHSMGARDLLRLLKRMYPGYPCIKRVQHAPTISETILSVCQSFRCFSSKKIYIYYIL
jgi:nucleoside-diphosphate-sugar epimerase